MARTWLVSALVWLAFATLAQAQEARVPYANVIRLATGEVVRTEGTIEVNQVVLRFPYEYRRTATLTEAMRGSGRFARGTVYADVGAPGFVAAELGYGGGATNPLWCFLRPDGTRPRDLACAYGSLVFQFVNPLLVDSIQYTDGQNTATAPQFTEGPVTLPFPLVIEYRFLRWTRDALVLEVRAGEERVGPYRVLLEADGSAILRTVAGAMRFERAGRQARASVLADDAAPDPLAAMVAAAPPGDFVAESALVATSPIAPADFTAVQRNAILFTQTVGPGPPLRQLSAPRDNGGRFGDAGALLFPAMRGRFPIACWQSSPPEFNNWSASWKADCLEDADGDGAYEVIWPNVTFINGNTFFISGFALTADHLRTPVRVEAASGAAQPSAELGVMYLGPSAERRLPSGELEITAVEFDWVINRTPAGRRFSAPVEGNSAIVRAPNGTVFGELRNFTANGAAEFKLNAGFPVGETSYLSGRAVRDDR